MHNMHLKKIHCLKKLVSSVETKPKKSLKTSFTASLRKRDLEVYLFCTKYYNMPKGNFDD